ncbi:hypothetical protein [Fulvivirga sp.]|uniref:hypothetical protein n=1 Tax=Fulvivirga sp. TaxID=1931237 RepID=UPI0032EF81D2
MTIQDIITSLATNSTPIFVYYGVMITVTILLLAILKESNVNTLKYVASTLVYGVSVPGIFAVLLTFYAFFLLKSSLLEVSITIYFFPIVMMVVVLFGLNRKLNMRSIPGFDKLSGLMILIALTMLIIFILQRTYFGILFVGGFFQLLVVFVILFLLLKMAWSKLTK